MGKIQSYSFPMNYESMSDAELVQECAKNTDPAAWKEFGKRFDRDIKIVVIRCCREWGVKSLDIVKDLCQDMYVKLLANNCSVLKRFKPQGPNSFRGFLKVITAHMVYDYFRSKIRELENTVELEEASQVHSSGHGNANSVEKEILFNEMDNLLRQRGTTDKERMIFWLYIRQGLTSKEIAALPGIGLTMKGVESVIHRLKELLKEELV